MGSLALFATSCNQNKEKRKKKKKKQSAEHKRNEGVDSATLSTDAKKADTVAAKKDTVK